MICALVFHHAFEIPNSGFFPRMGLTAALFNPANFINALTQWASMSAVPILSIISGILFFNSSATIANKIRKRLGTIVLPSVIWGTLWFVFAYLLYQVGNHRGLFEWANYHFEHITVLSIANGILGLTEEPFAFQFWFIHDLVLTIALTPLIDLLLKKIPTVSLVLLGAIWIAKVPLYVFFSSNVLFFFFLGAYFQRRHLSISNLANWLSQYSLLIVALFGVVLVARVFQHVHILLQSYQFLCLLRILGVMTSLIGINWIYNRRPAWAGKLQYYSFYSFFIFAFHYPVVEIVKTVFQRIPGQSSQLGLVVSFFLIPLLTIGFSIAAASIIKITSPKTLELLNGGRH
jgi:hypothetical protein